MSELNKLIEEFFHDQRERTHTAILARIEAYDPVEMKANIKPLIKEYYDTSGKGDYDHVELEEIKNASVACLRAGDTHIIRPPYKEGDIVLAVCADRSIDEVIETGDISEQVGRRRHSLQDALVIGGVTVEPHPLPEEHAEDLLICKADGQEIKTRMVLTDEVDSIIIAKGNSESFDASVIIHDNDDIEVFTKGEIDAFAKGNITAYSESNIKIEAEGDIDIIAHGTLTLKGKTVLINPGG